MVRKSIGLLLLALGFASAAWAQSSPPTPDPVSVYVASVPLSVTNSSARVALPSAVVSAVAVTISNDGAADACFALGSTSVAATNGCLTGASSSTSLLVRAGRSLTVFKRSTDVDIAAIAASATTLTVYQATGPVWLQGSTGGAGGSVTQGTTPWVVSGTVGIDQTTPGTTNGVVVNSSGLPTGASTAANQTAAQASPGSDASKAVAVQGVAGGKAVPTSDSTAQGSLASIATNTTGAATAAKQDTGNGSLATIATNTGAAATAANQTTANSSLSTVATNTTGVSTAANQTAEQTPIAPATATATKATAVGCQYNSSGITPTDGQQFVLQCGAKGGLSVGGSTASGTTDGGSPVKIGSVYNSSAPTVTTGQRIDSQADAHGSLKGIGVDPNGTVIDATQPIGTAPVPSSSATNAITPVVSTALESCHVLKNGAGNLYDLAVTIQATTGIVQLFNLTAAPGAGAVTPIWSQSVTSNGTLGGASWSWENGPVRFSIGITVCFSSATTPFTYTSSATAMFSGDVQ